MKAFVLYESMFGNTQHVAEAVAVGLRDRVSSVTTAEVGASLPTDLTHVDLLVVGVPTHALALSSARSRAEAVSRGAGEEHAVTGVREWLATLEAHPAREPRAAAVFDTRMSKVRHWPGSAGRQLVRRMRRRGFTVVDRETFYVRDLTGPLTDGELARAEQWGRELAALVVSAEGVGHVGA